MPYEKGKLPDEQYNKIQSNYPELLADIKYDPMGLARSLFKHQVFDADDLEKIKKEERRDDGGKSDAAAKLLDILLNCGSMGYGNFIRALKDSKYNNALFLLEPGFKRGEEDTTASGSLLNKPLRHLDNIIPNPLLVQLSYQLQNDKEKITKLGVGFGLEIETINRIFQQHQLRPEMAILTIFINWLSSSSNGKSKNEIKDEFIRIFYAYGMTELSNKLSEVLHRSFEMEPQQNSSTGTEYSKVGMKDIASVENQETHENKTVTSGEARIVEPPAPNEDNQPNTVMRDVEAIQNLSIQQPPQIACYKMDRKPRGYCIIINNEKFKRNTTDNDSIMKDRKGSSIDRDRLKETFDKLLFIVESYDNLKAGEMARKINQFALNEDHTNYDCFAVVILSHGTRDNVYGSDGKPVAIRDLTGPLKPLTCPSLCDKPKLFFIQACQGQERQQGLAIERDVTPENDIDENTPTRGEVIPNEADFLLGMSTIPGFVSFRNKKEGSWYITKLCETFNKYAKHFDILGLLTVVNKEVGEANADLDGGRFKQSPAPFYTLRKRLIFQ
ncbi:caspase-1 [Patella vulgata]|uniref:caspase-1 n=1 Tax=Patella vulgata TaxID=6465 RepID=UPI0024A96701|nr:caspase-1 [Patella vulgata]XP_050389600.2 caspase-1 [Patella vulgata]